MSTPPARQFSAYWPILIPAALIVVVVAVLYGFMPYSAGYNEVRVPVFTFAWNMWKLEEWQHCVLVPFAVILLIFLDREKLAILPIQRPSLSLIRSGWNNSGPRGPVIFLERSVVPTLAWPLVIFALALYWFGYQADVVYFGYVSMQILLAGLILVFFGVRWMLALAFAWMFIVFMWPLLFLDTQLAFPLRQIMSKASNTALNFIGIPSILSGTAILSASDPLTNRAPGDLFSVDVADPCSGIRSLFALMMVTALYAHFAVKGWWRKWLLFLCAAPLAVFGNLCRIIMLTLGTIAMGADVAIGTLEHPTWFHMMAGYLVFVVALVGMLGIGGILNVDWRKMFYKIEAYQRSQRKPIPPRAGGDAPAQPPENKDIY